MSVPCIMCSHVIRWSIVTLFLFYCPLTSPLSLLQSDHPPLAAGLSSRVASHAPRLQDAKADARLPLPTPQEIDAIRRVAQVLIMLGGQVIPSIIGEPPTMSSTQSATDLPHDAVSN